MISVNFHLRIKVLILFGTLLYSAGAADTIPQSKGGKYSLVLKVRMLKKLEVSWQGQFETPIKLDKPVNFKIKSTNGTLICHLLLTQNLTQYQLSYTFEAMVELPSKENVFYMKKAGETNIVLNEYIHISPWADIGHSSQRLRKISKDGSVEHYEKDDKPKHKKIDGRDEIILGFLVKKIK